MAEEFFTSKQAAKYLGISQHQIYKLSAAGKLITYSPTGGKIYFLSSDLEEWIRSGKKSIVKNIQHKVNKTFLNK